MKKLEKFNLKKSKTVILRAAKAACVLICLLVLGFFGNSRAGAYGNKYDTVRIGLRYGNSTLVTANLENAVGSGYMIGYFENGRDFVPLAYTRANRLTMMKDWTIYRSGTLYYDSRPEYGNFSRIGCYHIELDIETEDYEEALETAEGFEDGFVAYYSGLYYVCVGSYASYNEALEAAEDRGIDGTPMSASSCCVVVTETGTDRIIFEFDCGNEEKLGIVPMCEDGEKGKTWFKGVKYYGGFEYSRIDGGNLTVINVVDMEDYIKGIVPYEMSPSWPEEALKAQALCARTYAAKRIGYHSAYGFDLCDDQCCQRYIGTNGATEVSDSAVDETAGLYITYDGELCTTFYHSCDGGATEDSENVWTEEMPYLRGVKDEFEEYVKTGWENWSYTYTAEEITNILRSKGYKCADIVKVKASYTEMGNIYSITFTDSKGVNWSFKKYDAGCILYSSIYGKSTHSQHFTISSAADVSDIYINDADGAIAGDSMLYVLGTDGEVYTAGMDEGLYAVTSRGKEKLSSGGGSSDTYIVKGSGWGHNVGMSQYGAKAMAELGYTYDEIIHYYYTGVNIE